MEVLCLHAAGLGDLVAVSVAADLGAHPDWRDDSAMIITTSAGDDQLAPLGYVKNAFVVVGAVPRRGELPGAVDTLARRVTGWPLSRHRRPFRLMFSADGSLTAVPAPSRRRLEAAVARATGGRLTPRGGGEEFWAITRRDLDRVLFCRRLPRPKRGESPRGSLAPDVAQLIANAAPRRADDVVLDPFAGSGALVAARLTTPLRRAICSDIGYADGSVALLPGPASDKRLRTLSEDARTLPSVDDGSVDVIVTDPPWGEFDDDPAAADTAAASLPTLARVLRPGGTMVMLTARRLAESMIEPWRRAGFDLRDQHRALINGHPATVLVGTRSPGVHC